MKDNKILKLAFVLLVICAVTAGILGVVNALTAQRIYDMAHAKEFEAYAVVLESSSGYSELSFDKEAFPTVDSIMSSNDGNGYVVKSTFSGAQGSMISSAPASRLSSIPRPPASAPWRLRTRRQARPSAASSSAREVTSHSPRPAAASMRWPARRLPRTRLPGRRPHPSPRSRA